MSSSSSSVLLVVSRRGNVSEDGVGNVHRLVLHQYDVKGVGVRFFSRFHLRDTAQTVGTHFLETCGVDIRSARFKLSDLVIEEADGEDVLVL